MLETLSILSRDSGQDSVKTCQEPVKTRSGLCPILVKTLSVLSRLWSRLGEDLRLCQYSVNTLVKILSRLVKTLSRFGQCPAKTLVSQDSGESRLLHDSGRQDSVKPLFKALSQLWSRICSQIRAPMARQSRFVGQAML